MTTRQAGRHGGAGTAKPNPRTLTLVNRAKDTCAAMGRVLQATLDHLTESPPASAAEAKDLVTLVVAYQKALQTVLDFEKSLEQQTSRGPDESGIDLDGARREVLGKLARLAERG